MAAPMDWLNSQRSGQNIRGSWNQQRPAHFENQTRFRHEHHGQMSQNRGPRPRFNSFQNDNFSVPRFSVQNRVPFHNASSNAFGTSQPPVRHIQDSSTGNFNNQQGSVGSADSGMQQAPFSSSGQTAPSYHVNQSSHNSSFDLPNSNRIYTDVNSQFNLDVHKFVPPNMPRTDSNLSNNNNYNIGPSNVQRNDMNSVLRTGQHNLFGSYSETGMGNIAPPFLGSNTEMRNTSQNLHTTSNNIAEGVSSVLKMMKQETQPDQQTNEDHLWVKKWLEQKNRNVKIQHSKKPLKISEAHEKTRHMIVLLARLQKNKKHLDSMKHEDKSVWEQKHKEVMQIKSELEMLQKELTSPESVSGLQRKIAERRKKRERIKRRAQELYLQRQAELSARKQKHAEIDKAMQQIIQKQQEAKQEADMQKDGDQTLVEVRKKLSDANKTIQLLNGVQKLRKLRRDRLEKQGVLGMCDAGNTKAKFETMVGCLEDMLSKQLHTYKAEEEALKVILETEHEETREKEREKMIQKQIEKQKEQQKKEDQMLFGKQKDPRPGDPLYPFRQFYEMASSSLEALVSVRHEWDRYLVMPDTPGASPVPPGWVVPPESSSETWASALINHLR